MTNVFNLSAHISQRKVSTAKTAEDTAWNYLNELKLRSDKVKQIAPLLCVVRDRHQAAHTERARHQLEDQGNGTR